MDKAGNRVFVRFEHVPDGVVSLALGPFEFAQLTYDMLRVGPDGEELAHFGDGVWRLDPIWKARHEASGDEAAKQETWTDVVVYSV